tara:strand:- start:278 stop:2074 length:1797 start_codon:yes stop_codon:yes gene_type:complete
MASDQDKIVSIDYTHREFSTIREDLMELAERLYPDSFQDWSEASFGSLMIDAVAYVGDQLSFYLDYNVNETFMDTAYQYDNIVRHGRILGYKNEGVASTYGTVSLYVLVPASSTALGPDTRYIPLVKKGTRFTSQTGLNFVLTENIDFSDSSNLTVAAAVDSTTGAPTYYAIKTVGTVVSGYFSEETVSVGAYERFLNITLTANNIAEIISVFDSEGNEYFEVDYLAQDMVLKEISNNNYKSDNVPSILKPYLVSRKFVVERDATTTYLQFGSGKEGESDVVADPQSVAINTYGKAYVTNITFDPTRLSQNESLGIVPSNTTLTISYRLTNAANSNVATSGLNAVSAASMNFSDAASLVSSTMQDVINSLEVENEEPIIGDVTIPNSDELKRLIFDTFPTQNRAVTQADYESITYRMPKKFGSLKRCSMQKDPNSQKRNLNLYVVSENSSGKLATTNSTIKENLKTWLNQYRMLNDTVDILDAYILNFGIDFIIKAASTADKYTLLDEAIAALATSYETVLYIGEPFYISDIYSTLKNVTGVLDVTKVTVSSKTGTNYSNANIVVNDNLSPDGSYVIVPANALVEIRYPTTDITGKVI